MKVSLFPASVLFCKVSQTGGADSLYASLRRLFYTSTAHTHIQNMQSLLCSVLVSRD